MKDCFLFDPFSLMFLSILGINLFIQLKGIHEWNKNNDSPKVTVNAKVVAKRSKTTHFHREDNGLMFMNLASIYYITFEIQSEDKVEMRVNVTDYRRLYKGDCGKLTFQGTRYISFEKCLNIPKNVKLKDLNEYDKDLTF